MPITFAKYIAVKQDFRYSDCYKSKECFELPLEIIPKRMNIISRADLTLERPAAQGIVYYKKISSLKQQRRLSASSGFFKHSSHLATLADKGHKWTHQFS